MDSIVDYILRISREQTKRPRGEEKKEHRNNDLHQRNLQRHRHGGGDGTLERLSAGGTTIAHKEGMSRPHKKAASRAYQRSNIRKPCASCAADGRGNSPKSPGPRGTPRSAKSPNPLKAPTPSSSTIFSHFPTSPVALHPHQPPRNRRSNHFSPPPQPEPQRPTLSACSSSRSTANPEDKKRKFWATLNSMDLIKLDRNLNALLESPKFEESSFRDAACLLSYYVLPQAFGTGNLGPDMPGEEIWESVMGLLGVCGKHDANYKRQSVGKPKHSGPRIAPINTGQKGKGRGRDALDTNVSDGPSHSYRGALPGQRLKDISIAWGLGGSALSHVPEAPGVAVGEKKKDIDYDGLNMEVNGDAEFHLQSPRSTYTERSSFSTVEVNTDKITMSRSRGENRTEGMFEGEVRNKLGNYQKPTVENCEYDGI